MSGLRRQRSFRPSSPKRGSTLLGHFLALQHSSPGRGCPVRWKRIADAVQIKDAVAKCIRPREVIPAMPEIVRLYSIFSRDAFTGAIR